VTLIDKHCLKYIECGIIQFSIGGIMNYPELNALSSTLNLEGEVWKSIKGFENYYAVSNLGRVKRVKCSSKVVYKSFTCLKSYEELVIKANNDTRGYPQVSLGFNKKRVARVHRLVAEAFLEAPSSLLQNECKAAGLNYVLVNHIDENSCNANISNLEWCSPLHNNIHGKSRKGIKSKSGSMSKSSTLNEGQVAEIILLLKAGILSQENIAKTYNVKQITISNIWTGRSWSHFTGIPWKGRIRGKSRNCLRIAEKSLLD